MVRFENVPIISLAQRLAIEKQLLLEEKYLVFSVKKIKEERQALQREGTDLFFLTQDILSQGTRNNANSQNTRTATTFTDTSEVSAPTTSMYATSLPSSLRSEFSLQGLDTVDSNDVELNLTVPSHNCCADQMPEEEYEDIEMEEDFVLDIGMLMNVENAYK